MVIIFSIFWNKSHFTYLKCHTQNPWIPPNNLIKENTRSMLLFTKEPLILTGKLLLTALKSVISSPKFTNVETISDKNNWDSLYFHKKVNKKTLGLVKVTQNPTFPLTQCCTKPEEAMPGSQDHKWVDKLATNIEEQERGCQSNNFFHWL